MSQSRLSLARYGTPSVYHAKASDLFESKNRVLSDETLPTFLADFKRLFEQTQETALNLYDTILTVEAANGSEHVFAQRQLLIARSAYFENVFNPESPQDHECTLEEDDDGIAVITFKPSFHAQLDMSLLRDVVAYMYWGYCEPGQLERTKCVFELASLLDLKDLRNYASDELTKYFGPKNVAEFLVSAVRYEGKRLKQNCIAYIIENKRLINPKYLEHVLLKFDNGDKLIAEIYEKEVFSSGQVLTN